MTKLSFLSIDIGSEIFLGRQNADQTSDAWAVIRAPGSSGACQDPCASVKLSEEAGDL